MISLTYCILLVAASGRAGWLWHIIDEDDTMGVVFPVAQFFACVVVGLLVISMLVIRGECHG